MLFTQSIKQTPRWHTLIRRERKRLGLNKTDFGRMFGVTRQAVSFWEDGTNDPPGAVTWYLYQRREEKLNGRR